MSWATCTATDLLDLPFPVKIRNELVESGRAEVHHVLPESGWVKPWHKGGRRRAARHRVVQAQLPAGARCYAPHEKPSIRAHPNIARALLCEGRHAARDNSSLAPGNNRVGREHAVEVRPFGGASKRWTKTSEHQAIVRRFAPSLVIALQRSPRSWLSVRRDCRDMTLRESR